MPISDLPAKKRIALVAHDGCKGDLLEWTRHNRAALLQHDLYATGGTGALIAAQTGLKVHRYMSGPWAATSRSAQPSQRAGWTCWSSSGTRCSPSPTIRT